MGCCGGFIGAVFNPVVETVVNPIVEPVIEQVVQPVVKAVEQTVQAALDNPLQTAAIATAMATGQTYLIPYINAGFALDAGQSPEKALQSAAISYAGTQVGGAVGAETGSALAGNVAGGTTQGLLSGKPLDQSLAGSLTNTAISQVTPSGLLSSNGTTGATNMADTNFFSGYDPNQAIVQDNTILAQNPYLPSGVDLTNAMTGGEGFGPGGNYLTPQEIARLQPSVYSGSGDVNSSILSSLDTATQALIKKALAAGGSSATAAQNFLSSLLGGSSGANLIQGGLQTAGGLMQTQASRDAALKAQQDLLAATGSATTGSQFRPVGVTTRFGTSQFNINPATGQLESAGYTAAPEITSAQNQLLNLGASYLAQTPEQVAQNYLSKQYDLLDPSRQRQLANIRNQQFQTGRGGLSVGSTGLRPSGAQGLMGANPELEAYYNALAQQDAQLAAGAQTAGQQQVLYGAGLFGQAGNLENMAQQPFTLGTGLGTSISGAGANAGRLGLTGASLAAGYGTSPAATTRPGAYIASGLGSPTSTLGAGLANWLTSSAPTTGGITNQGMMSPTVDAYGNYVPLGYANY